MASAALALGLTLAVSASPMAVAIVAENSRRSIIQGCTMPVAQGEVPGEERAHV